MEATEWDSIPDAFMTARPLFIDGRFVDAIAPETIDVIDPATTEVIATIPDAGQADIDAAVAAARRAFNGPWRRVSAQERGRILFRIAQVLRASAGALAEI